MFDHTIAVISNISRSLKKYLNIVSIITQLLFMGYYAYLIVVNITKLQFLIAYSVLEAIETIILLIDIIGAFRDLDYHGRRLKARTKRIIHYFSWVIKLAVIIFNIIVIVRGEATEVGMMFLIFSSVFLLIQMILTLMSRLFSYHLDLLLYGLRMDYVDLTEEESIENRPLGKVINNVTKNLDYHDDINEFSIKYEVRNAIKKELDKEFPLKINNKLVTRRKAEHIVFHYYRKSNRYYLSSRKLSALLTKLNDEHITYLTSDDHLFVLLFFANNHVNKVYKGLGEYTLKLVIATLLFISDGNDRSIVDLTYKAIGKELLDVDNWSKELKEPKGKIDYHKVIKIINETKEELKNMKEATIASEFKDIIVKEVEKKIDLPRPISRIIHHFIDK